MTKRSPELETDHVDLNDERQRRDTFNLDMRGLAKSIRVLARGRNNEVASRNEGVKRIWTKDLSTGKNVALVVRNGRLEVE